MKKLFQILITITLCLWLAYILVFLVFPSIKVRFQTEGVANLGKVLVDNDYNNRICSSSEDLVQIHNRLYYNYARNYCNYGTYEISENGIRRIFWDGFDLLRDEIPINPIRKHNEQLIMFCREDTFAKRFLFEQNKFEITNYPYIALNFQAVNNEIYYTGHSQGDFKLYVLKDGQESLVLDKDVSMSFYCYENIIYYVTKNKDGRTFELWTYDIINEKDELFAKLEHNFTNFLIEDNCIFAERDDSTVVRIDLQQPSGKIVEDCIFSDEKVEAINAWNKKIYICTKSGLFQYDIDSKKTVTLYDYSAFGCYIVDGYWLYFVDKNSALWRIPQNGGKAEKVFG